MLSGQERARMVVLVGPKGSGKTTIGRMLERHPGVHFLNVETIARRVLEAMGKVIDENYARRAFDEILSAIRSIEEQHEVIVIETTGASEETPRFLAALGERYDLRLVRIHARPETCAARIHSRDQSAQIQVSAELIEEMLKRSMALSLPWDLEIDNDPAMPAEEVERAFAPLLRGGA